MTPAAACQVPNTVVGNAGRGNRRPGKDFDTIFFLYLVPPILFESGYSLNHKDFFRNFTAIVLFATVGTVVSAVRHSMLPIFLCKPLAEIRITNSSKNATVNGTEGFAAPHAPHTVNSGCY